MATHFVDTHRPRPNDLVVALFSAAMLLIALQLGALLLNVTHVFAAKVIVGAQRPVFVPFAESPLLPSSPSADPSSAAVAPAVLLAAAAVILYFWPSTGRLANRLAIPLVTVGFVLILLAVAFEMPFRQWLEGDLSVPSIWRLAGVALALLLLEQAERRAALILGNFFPIDTPVARLRTWAIRLPLPLLVVVVSSMATRYKSLALAAVVTLAFTLLFSLIIRLPQQYEELRAIQMREEMIAALLGALIFVGGSIVLFGSPLTREPQRALLLGGAKPAFSDLVAVRENIRHPRAAQPQGKKGETPEDETPKEEPKIDIRWSKPKS